MRSLISILTVLCGMSSFASVQAESIDLILKADDGENVVVYGNGDEWGFEFTFVDAYPAFQSPVFEPKIVVEERGADCVVTETELVSANVASDPVLRTYRTEVATASRGSYGSCIVKVYEGWSQRLLKTISFEIH